MPGRLLAFAYNPNISTSRAFLWQNGAITDLTPPGYFFSVAYTINNAGQIVGVAYNLDSSGNITNERAFLWQNGTLTDLNDLIPANSGWVLEFASGINDTGQIVGGGTFQGQARAFLLTPTSGSPTPIPVVITNLNVSNLGPTNATINWTTNIAANSVVEYGTTSTYGHSVSTGGLVTSHSLNLGGLSSNTLYHYRVKSTANGNTAVSADNTFVTGPLGYIDFHITHSAVRKLSNGGYAVDVTFSNHGGQPIPTVQVTGVVLGNAVATGFFPGSLPLEFGLLGGTQATYTFTFPASAGASGTSVTLAVHGGLLDDFDQYIEFYSFYFRGVPLP